MVPTDIPIDVRPKKEAPPGARWARPGCDSAAPGPAWRPRLRRRRGRMSPVLTRRTYGGIDATNKAKHMVNIWKTYRRNMANIWHNYGKQLAKKVDLSSTNGGSEGIQDLVGAGKKGETMWNWGISPAILWILPTQTLIQPTHIGIWAKKHGWLNVLSYDLSKESGGFTLRIASVNGNVIYYACNIYICVKLDFVSPQNWGVNQKGHSCGSSESWQLIKNMRCVCPTPGMHIHQLYG